MPRIVPVAPVMATMMRLRRGDGREMLWEILELTLSGTVRDGDMMRELCLCMWKLWHLKIVG